MKYKLIDLQGAGMRENLTYNSKQEILEDLLHFHSQDYTGENNIKDLSLADLLDYGDWEIEEICEICGMVEDEDGRCGCTNKDSK